MGTRKNVSPAYGQIGQQFQLKMGYGLSLLDGATNNRLISVHADVLHCKSGNNASFKRKKIKLNNDAKAEKYSNNIFADTIKDRPLPLPYFLKLCLLRFSYLMIFARLFVRYYSVFQNALKRHNQYQSK